MNEWINDEADCRTAAATPSLLIMGTGGGQAQFVYLLGENIIRFDETRKLLTSQQSGPWTLMSCSSWEKLDSFASQEL